MQAFSVPVLPAHPRIRQRTALVASAEPLGGASETKPEAAIAAIRAKGSPSTNGGTGCDEFERKRTRCETNGRTFEQRGTKYAPR
jgi:hypothetical protein